MNKPNGTTPTQLADQLVTWSMLLRRLSVLSDELLRAGVLSDVEYYKWERLVTPERARVALLMKTCGASELARLPSLEAAKAAGKAKP